MQTKAYAAQSASSPLAPFSLERREPGPHDVVIDIQYCGVCHSDIHQARDEWGGSVFPMVPGHEIIGTVAAMGSAVKKFKTGDRVGVGCLVDSCGTCQNCQDDLEQFCPKMVGTYNSRAKDGSITYGGYSTRVVVDESFTLRIPDNLDMAAAAPLLCAGITTYSPLRTWKAGPGQRLGVVGLGGLGHMAVKLGHAMGCEVTVFSTSRTKEADARRLGASGFIATKESGSLAAAAGKFDLIINTVSAPQDLNGYLATLKRDGTMVLVGVPPEPTPVAAFSLIMGRKRLAGSLIGGIAETQEMLDFCGKHGITSDVEMIAASQINDAYERMLAGKVHYRFVIDCATI